MPPHRILIVDDEKDVLNAWARALRLANYSVWTAGNAAEAMSLSEEHSFDLVILDYIMPSMDGVELLRRIRKRLPLVRSILISGQIDKKSGEGEVKSIVTECIEVDIYLHKPISNENFLNRVKELLLHNQPEQSWREIAHQSVTSKSVTSGKIRETSKKLKALVKKKPR